jgi:hypothetical protein
MRTLNLIASLTVSFAVSNALASDNNNSAGISDEEAARIQAEFERDLSGFICGTVDEKDADDSGDRNIDRALSQTDVANISAALAAASSSSRGSDVGQTEPDSNANTNEIQDPDFGLPVGQGLVGDLTGDGFVNVDDILLVLQGWGACTPVSLTQCIGDVNLDGYVNQRDLLLVLMNWN